MTKHTISIQLKDLSQNAQEGALIELNLPEGVGVNDAHVSEYLNRNRRSIGFVVDMDTVKLGNVEIPFSEYGGYQWLVVSSENV